jgi:hypothetical protein
MSDTLLADLKAPDRHQRRALLRHIESLTAGSSSVDILGWATQYMRYPKSDRFPTFDRANAPHINFPLEQFASGKWRIISLMAPTGFGKSTLIETAVSYGVAVAPGDIGIATQSDADSASFSDDRLLPTLRAVEPVHALLPNDRYSIKKAQISFPHLEVYIGGANLTTLQSKSLRYVFLDEAWMYKAGMVGEALRRTHDRANGVVFITGQAGLVGDEFDEIHKTGALHEYSWRCEACGNFHPYEFKDVKWSPDARDEMGWRWTRIAETCYMQCPTCPAHYPDNEHSRKQLALTARYLPVADCNPMPGRLALHAHVLGIPWVRWGDIAIEFVEANEARKAGNDVKFRQWQQKREARPYKIDTASYQLPEIKTGGFKTGDYENGEKIEGEVFRCQTVDVQQDHLWICVIAWRADGGCRILHYDEHKDWGKIKEIAMRYHTPKICVFLDARDGNQTRTVYQYCAQNGTCALMGDKAADYTHTIKGKSVKRFYSVPSQVAINNGKCSRILWSSESIKDLLHAIRTKIEIPDDFDSRFSDQMSAEVKQKIISKTTGAVTFRWKPISDGRDNHAWDCMAMAVAAALISKRVVFPFQPEVVSESNSPVAA